MPVTLGTGAVTLKLGTQSVVGYLGDAIVTATVPAAPTITIATYIADNTETRVAGVGANNGLEVTSVRVVFSEAGEELPDAEANLSNNGGNYEFDLYFSTDFSGQTVQVFATNSAGQGAGSTPTLVTLTPVP
jgi:hypothetical protein